MRDATIPGARVARERGSESKSAISNLPTLYSASLSSVGAVAFHEFVRSDGVSSW